MITRDNFKGIDTDLFEILKDFFETLSPRMVYHLHNDLFHAMEQRLTGYENINSSISCTFERQGEKVTLSLSDFSIEITFDTFNTVEEEKNHDDSITDYPIAYMPAEDSVTMYYYRYENKDGAIEVFEEGDYEYFSIKIHEIYTSIGIDDVLLNKID